MRYRNKKTGATIDVTSEIFGENWVADQTKEEQPKVEQTKPHAAEAKAPAVVRKKTTKKASTVK